MILLALGKSSIQNSSRGGGNPTQASVSAVGDSLVLARSKNLKGVNPRFTHSIKAPPLAHHIRHHSKSTI